MPGPQYPPQENKTISTSSEYFDLEPEVVDTQNTRIEGSNDEQYEYFVNTNPPESNDDAFKIVADESKVSEYRGKIRALSRLRPEILGVVEFKPLYYIDEEGESLDGSNLDPLNKNKTKECDNFDIQSHMRIIIQDLVSDFISKSVSYDIKSLIKDISFAMEDGKVFNYEEVRKIIGYSQPFPAKIDVQKVVSYLKEKNLDTDLASKIEESQTDRYVELILQYFFNSCYADEIMSDISARTQEQQEITEVIEVITEEQPQVSAEVLIEGSEDNKKPSTKSLAQYVLETSGEYKTLVDFYSAFGIAGSAPLVDTEAYSLVSSSPATPDIITIHRLLHATLLSCYGVDCGMFSTNDGENI